MRKFGFIKSNFVLWLFSLDIVDAVSKRLVQWFCEHGVMDVPIEFADFGHYGFFIALGVFEASAPK